mmetsp:Transcript_21434/g.45073  ORF Transcript_21434/g.45073 Transcript_21434/m.45073 type:complete len:93 (+) Transcript_21434:2521-2799(+)
MAAVAILMMDRLFAARMMGKKCLGSECVVMLILILSTPSQRKIFLENIIIGSPHDESKEVSSCGNTNVPRTRYPLALSKEDVIVHMFCRYYV